MCVEITHRVFPRAWWVLIGQGQHQIHECGNGPGIIAGHGEAAMSLLPFPVISG
jgi:hypothetical protein